MVTSTQIIRRLSKVFGQFISSLLFQVYYALATSYEPGRFYALKGDNHYSAHLPGIEYLISLTVKAIIYVRN